MRLTENQQTYMDTIAKYPITFCSGPAGTGKTYIAVAYAVQSGKDIVACRPAIEAGEKLGFLPGTHLEKIDPYIQPIVENIKSFCRENKTETIEQIMKRVVVATLAHMRGRTFYDSVVILDEAQNTTVNQMKMVLTRLGRKSKIIVTGDVDQSDIGHANGFADALARFQARPNYYGFASLTATDNHRHVVVQDVLEAYSDGSKNSGKS